MRQRVEPLMTLTDNNRRTVSVSISFWSEIPQSHSLFQILPGPSTLTFHLSTVMRWGITQDVAQASSISRLLGHSHNVWNRLIYSAASYQATVFALYNHCPRSVHPLYLHWKKSIVCGRWQHEGFWHVESDLGLSLTSGWTIVCRQFIECCTSWIFHHNPLTVVTVAHL